jgi:hypothetical protein
MASDDEIKGATEAANALAAAWPTWLLESFEPVFARVVKDAGHSDAHTVARVLHETVKTELRRRSRQSG